MGELREISGKPVGSSAAAQPLIEFDDFRFDARTGELWHDRREVQLTPRAAAVLAVLARHAPQLTKERLFAAVWERKAVTDEALTSRVQELRLWPSPTSSP